MDFKYFESDMIEMEEIHDAMECDEAVLTEAVFVDDIQDEAMADIQEPFSHNF